MTINIYIKGGTKTQQRVTDEAARVFIKQLLPRKRTLNIDITIRNTLKENAAGYCTHEDRDQFHVELHNRGTLFDYLSFLAHELVHVKQYSNRELVNKSYKSYWMGVDYSDVAYSKLPWEKEAWSSQYPMSKNYIKNNLGMTFGKAKNTSPRTMKKINWEVECKVLEATCDAQ
jgi:hypothetical protein